MNLTSMAGDELWHGEWCAGPSVTSVLKRGLSHEGFVVDTAASGAQALDIARERYPALVILDVMMPGMDGLAVHERLRAADPQLPVLDASYELRAPLTAIQANLELLERQPDTPVHERHEAIAEGSCETHRLSCLVSDLLALARADAGVPLRWRRPVFCR